jgi:hypothetical protein
LESTSFKPASRLSQPLQISRTSFVMSCGGSAMMGAAVLWVCTVNFNRDESVKSNLQSNRLSATSERLPTLSGPVRDDSLASRPLQVTTRLTLGSVRRLESNQIIAIDYSATNTFETSQNIPSNSEVENQPASLRTSINHLRKEFQL